MTTGMEGSQTRLDNGRDNEIAVEITFVDTGAGTGVVKRGCLDSKLGTAVADTTVTT